jgi:hypothetical protein
MNASSVSSLWKASLSIHDCDPRRESTVTLDGISELVCPSLTPFCECATIPTVGKDVSQRWNAMAKKSKPITPLSTKPAGKQRTREHVIAGLSMNFVERLVLKCGYVAQRTDPDYGYDLRLETFDEQGSLEAEQIPLQLKATDRIEEYELATEETFSVPISTKHYRLWSEELMPVFLILYDSRLEEAYWLHIQEYDQAYKPKLDGDTIRVHIPRKQVLGVQTIRLMRERKQEILRSLKASLPKKPSPKES